MLRFNSVVFTASKLNLCRTFTKQAIKKKVESTPLPTLIQTDELHSLIQSKADIQILDSTFKIPIFDFKPKTEHYKERIPNAGYFDPDEIADKNLDLVHKIPDLDTWQFYTKILRINPKKPIIVYDKVGNITSPRAWWMFKCFGVDVRVLDGGLKKWKSEGLPVQSGAYKIYDYSNANKALQFKYNFDSTYFVTHQKVVEVSKAIESNQTKEYQLLDARPEKRFQGEEGLPGIPNGHIPASCNLFFKHLYRENGTFKSPEEMKQEFLKRNINFSEEVTTIHSCGSGATACINALAMHLCGKRNWKVYDGSWIQYAFSGEKIAMGV